jgi:hypothetical protein
MYTRFFVATYDAEQRNAPSAELLALPLPLHREPRPDWWLQLHGWRLTVIEDRLSRRDGARRDALAGWLSGRYRQGPETTDVALTGIPRSGTTLITHLLNQVDDVLALSEPLRPAQLMRYRGHEEVVQEIGRFFGRTRRAVLAEKRVVGKSIDGSDTADHFEAFPIRDGDLRREIAARGELKIAKELSPEFTLVVKDLPTMSAVAMELTKWMRAYAVVRNPLSILASWNTVDMPVSQGRTPHGEWFDPDLGRKLSRICSTMDRQLYLLSWWFERVETAFRPEAIIRYEDVVATRGQCLRTIVPAAGDLAVTLVSRNTNPAYARCDLDRLADPLLGTDGPYWDFYDRSEVISIVTEWQAQRVHDAVDTERSLEVGVAGGPGEAPRM